MRNRMTRLKRVEARELTQSLPSFDVKAREGIRTIVPEPVLNPDIVLALAYAERDLRAPFTTLFRLDAQLGRIVASAREPQLARIKLAWWREQLLALGGNAHPVDPVLVDCNDLVCRYDVTGDTLAAIAHGYDELIDAIPLSTDALEAFASGRGGLFCVAAQIAGCDPSPLLMSAGRAWALTDYAFHCGDRVTAERSMALANEDAPSHRYKWPKQMRTFRILSAFATFDLRSGLEKYPATGTPRRLWHLMRALLQ
jgi:15-cis-phytoene synthase